MNFLKSFLIFSALAIFAAACTQNASNSGSNSTSNGMTNGSGAVNTPTNSANAPATNELAAAQKIYEEKCIKCHKADGMGGVTDIEGTKIKAPNFTTDRHKAMPDSEYVDTIENGAKEDGMPAYKGKISDDEIKNLVKYIRKNFQGK